MSRHELTDHEWNQIAKYLPKRKEGRGRPMADERKTINGILYVLHTGCAWMDMPRKYGSYTTCWRRHRTYVKRGIWDRVWRFMLRDLYEEKKLSLEAVHLDASFVPAKKGEPKLVKLG